METILSLGEHRANGFFGHVAADEGMADSTAT